MRVTSLCAGQDEDLAKLVFTKAACCRPDPFAVVTDCDAELNGTLEWLSSKSSKEVNEYRRSVIDKIEALAAVSCCYL